MWTSKTLLLGLSLAALAAPALSLPWGSGASGSTSLYDENARQAQINEQRQRIRSRDSEELREAIDETQALFSSLAFETAQQDRAVVEEQLQALRSDFKLPEAEKGARKAIQLCEEIETIKGGIKQQQAKLTPLPTPDADAATPDAAGATVASAQDREEARLLGLQSDLMSTVEDLRKELKSLHSDLSESGLRDLRNWAMVSEGLLRHRREAAEAAAKLQKAAEALPIDAGAVRPLSSGAAAIPEPPAPDKAAKSGKAPRAARP